jgi:hypothetical protein
MQVCAESISVHQQVSFSLFESPKLSLDSRISSNWDATLQLGFSSSAATLYLQSCGGEEASPFLHELLLLGNGAFILFINGSGLGMYLKSALGREN